MALATTSTQTKLSVFGGNPLYGTVKASGAKNAALPLLAGTILLNGKTTIYNVPCLDDVITIIRMLNALGVRAEYQNGCVQIWNNKKIRHIAPYELITAMRASFFVAGPILAKTGYAKIPHPGGCSIGSRPVDIHLKGFRALGAEIRIEHGFVELKAKKLKGAVIDLDFPSVGATENIMMAATLAEGETVINNAAREPEITDLANFLNQAGAKISGIDTASLTITGVPQLNGINYSVISDRIEAGTLLMAGAITGGDVTVENIDPVYLEAVLNLMVESGLDVHTNGNSIRVRNPQGYNGVSFETHPFPGFPTDLQAPMMAMLTLAKGQSVVKETIFENRFMHAQELIGMGADIHVESHCAFINGVEKLTGAEVRISDLRAGAALILAGLAAEGKSVVHGLKHLRRGYENLPEKLRALGAIIHE